jgi:hypothetical protein
VRTPGKTQFILRVQPEKREGKAPPGQLGRNLALRGLWALVQRARNHSIPRPQVGGNALQNQIGVMFLAVVQGGQQPVAHVPDPAEVGDSGDRGGRRQAIACGRCPGRGGEGLPHFLYFTLQVERQLQKIAVFFAEFSHLPDKRRPGQIDLREQSVPILRIPGVLFQGLDDVAQGAGHAVRPVSFLPRDFFMERPIQVFQRLR